MSIALVGATSTLSATGGTSGSITLPTGIADGDYGLLLVAQNGTQAISSPPSGWTQVGTTQTVATTSRALLYARSMLATDSGASASVTYAASQRHSKAAIVFRGVKSALNVEADTNDATANATAVLPAVTPTEADCLLVGFTFGRSAVGTTTYTPPGGWVERLDANDASGATPWYSLSVVTKQLVGGANVSTGTATLVPSTNVTDCLFTVALAPEFFKGWGLAR